MIKRKGCNILILCMISLAFISCEQKYNSEIPATANIGGGIKLWQDKTTLSRNFDFGVWSYASDVVRRRITSFVTKDYTVLYGCKFSEAAFRLTDLGGECYVTRIELTYNGEDYRTFYEALLKNISEYHKIGIKKKHAPITIYTPSVVIETKCFKDTVVLMAQVL